MLRYRDGPTDREFTAPATIMGEVVETDEQTVTIASHGRATTLYLADLLPLFGTSAMTLGVMLDAREHHDRVKVALTRERVTYDNPTQLARFRAKTADAGE